MAMTITIDGTEFEVTHVHKGDYLPNIEVAGSRNMDFYVARSTESAGKAARKRWADMVKSDPREFEAMVGAENLVKWAMGEWAGPGSTQVKSLKAWLDLHLSTPEEEFASYDGREDEVTACSKELRKALGFTPKVAYRHN